MRLIIQGLPHVFKNIYEDGKEVEVKKLKIKKEVNQNPFK